VGHCSCVGVENAAESPNDPKLSDGGGWREPCAGEGGGGRRRFVAWLVTAVAVRCSAWLGVAGHSRETSNKSIDERLILVTATDEELESWQVFKRLYEKAEGYHFGLVQCGPAEEK